jgi:hypothetical protein
VNEKRIRPGWPASGALGVFAVGLGLVTAASAPAEARTSGSERFDGGLVVRNVSGNRIVNGSVVAATGVFNGVGRIVERPNHPGESDSVSRDDLVFAEGTIHIKNVSKKFSVVPNPKTCTLTTTITQTTTVEGGTGRFAKATGGFEGAVNGSGVARRKADGSCDQKSLLLVEVDRVTGTGTLTF